MIILNYFVFLFNFMKLKYCFVLIIINYCVTKFNKNTLIISLSSNIKNIKSAHMSIYSILKQKANNSLYKILLILPQKEFNKNIKIPIIYLLLVNLNKIRIIFIKNKINLQTRVSFYFN